MNKVLVEAELVSHSYHKEKVLDNISFSLHRGEIVALLGKNGAGKTTLMSILAGIKIPDKGRVLIDGVDFNDSKIRRRIGYLLETNPLYSDMYVKEYLMYVAQIYSDKKNAKESVDYLIEHIGLKLEYKKRIGALSKGNKQRVGLAQALVHDPDILILDEPSNGYDPYQQEEMKDLLHQLRNNKTIVLSTHHLIEVSGIADRFMILNNQNIIYDGRPDDASTIETIFYNCVQ